MQLYDNTITAGWAGTTDEPKGGTWHLCVTHPSYMGVIPLKLSGD